MSTSTTNPIVEALSEIVALLEGIGIPASRDPSAFTPPGAIVGAPTVLSTTHGGAATVSVPVYLVTGDVGSAGLEEMLAMVWLALPALGVGNATPTHWISPINREGLPAYLITFTATVSEG